jgi:hypothetical protein
MTHDSFTHDRFGDHSLPVRLVTPVAIHHESSQPPPVPEDASTFNRSYAAALLAAVVGLFFLAARDWWMVASSVSLSVGAALIGWGREADGPHLGVRYAGYALLGVALATLIIDTLEDYVL